MGEVPLFTSPSERVAIQVKEEGPGAAGKGLVRERGLCRKGASGGARKGLLGQQERGFWGCGKGVYGEAGKVLLRMWGRGLGSTSR